ncbi:MAG TPA: GNVR domain-containing protein, partial [Burkholderiaceae bacterium]|nr:GNVR domain-containing protein [Burkholderiaceae bacterium]
RRSNAEQAFNQARSGEGRGYESSPAVVGNPVVQKAREAESAAERRLAEVGASYGTAHPIYANARSELDSARANVARQAQLVVASLQKEFNAARATEHSLEEALQRSRGTIQQLNRKDIEAGQLEREVETNRQIYQTFLARYKETTATSDLRLPNARLIDVAVPSLYPVKPNRPMIVAMSAIAGALVAALVVVALRRINNTVLRRADVEDRLRQPVLAALPRLQGERSRQRSREVMLQPDSVYSESVRTANTGVMLSMLDSRRKIVAISSSVPGEGKSTFALNFCLSLAQSTSVVLVEADLRRPTLARAAGLSEPPRQTTAKAPPASGSGLTHLLAGTCPLDEALQTVPGSDLQCIVAGRRPQNPLMVLGSRRFEQLLDTLAERFEVVVIDCPPVQAVSDPLVIGRHATGLVFMVQGASTPLPLAAEALKRFASVGVPVLGVIVNAHDFEAAERYHGEYSGYGKYGYN